MGDCIFCKIANGEIPSNIIYEDEHAVAILDLNPESEGHTLVIPKKHATTIDDMSADEMAHLFYAVKKVAEGIKKAIQPDGLNLLQNNGSAAWQVVPHVHVHLIPRHNGDDISFPAKSRTRGENLEAVAAKIKAAME